MPKCAFLTMSDPKGWFIDDDLSHEPLNKLGWEVQTVPWTEKSDWNEYDLTIIRSTWDYQDNLNHFLEVLDEIEHSRSTLLNSSEIVKWNIDKKYLLELEKQHISVVQTEIYSSLSEEILTDAFDRFQVQELVIKPTISANAYHTHRLRKDSNTLQDILQKLPDDKEWLIQPFMENIVSEGEYSLMYVQGRLTHTILKTAGDDDYRVQQEHGGMVSPIADPPEELVESAQKVLDNIPDTPFYSRVDLVRTSGENYSLMELELIEPSMYFKYGEGSAQKFAEAIDLFWKNKS